MSAPKYLVTAPPGVPVPGVGFLQPGAVFTAPSDDYVPSRTFRPCNEEAKVVLEKLFDARKTALEKALADEIDDKLKVSYRHALRDLAIERSKSLVIVEIAAPVPVVEEGLTLKQLAELASAPGAAPATKPAQPAPAKGGRAADK
jgi:hypothetical protein